MGVYGRLYPFATSTAPLSENLWDLSEILGMNNPFFFRGCLRFFGDKTWKKKPNEFSSNISRFDDAGLTKAVDLELASQMMDS